MTMNQISTIFMLFGLLVLFVVLAFIGVSKAYAWYNDPWRTSRYVEYKMASGASGTFIIQYSNISDAEVEQKIKEQVTESRAAFNKMFADKGSKLTATKDGKPYTFPVDKSGMVVKSWEWIGVKRTTQ